MAKQFQFDDFAPQGTNPNCVACEEMLTDAVDGVLSPADQAFFDLHIGTCTTCMDRLAEAKRGAAWLELLKTHRPEPSGALMQRILSATAAPISENISLRRCRFRPMCCRSSRVSRRFRRLPALRALPWSHGLR